MEILSGAKLGGVVIAEALMGMVVVFLNTLVVFVILRPRNKNRLRSVTNILVTNVALVDVLRGLTTMPSKSAYHVAWPRHFGACVALLSLENALHKMSCLGFIFLTWERYTAVCHPYRYGALFTDKWIAGYCAATWLVGAVIGGIPPIIWNEWSERMPMCHSMVYSQAARTWWNAIAICTSFTIYVIVMYLLIGRVIARHRRQIHEQNVVREDRVKLQQQFNGTVRCFLIVAVFAITRLPMVALNILTYFAGVECEDCMVVFDWLLIMQSAANPMIYALGSARLRREIRRSLRCLTDAAGDGSDVTPQACNNDRAT